MSRFDVVVYIIYTAACVCGFYPHWYIDTTDIYNQMIDIYMQPI